MARIPRPQGHHSITPGFSVPDRKAAVVAEFIEKGLGGRITERYDAPDGTIAHCEAMLGDSIVMFGDAHPGFDPMPASLSLYVDDGPTVDETYRRALKAGATSITEPKNMFYGYRTACVRDAGGNRWTICAIVEQITKEEVDRRMADLMKGQGAC